MILKATVERVGRFSYKISWYHDSGFPTCSEASSLRSAKRQIREQVEKDQKPITKPVYTWKICENNNGKSKGYEPKDV